MTPAVLVVALVLSAPALYRGFVTSQMSVDGALVVFLAAVLAAWVGRSLLMSLLGSYASARASDALRAGEAGAPRRRREDGLPGDEA
ncbi:MAG: hypothetical protein ACTHK1_04060 [Actinomycetales bacterium]